MNESYHEAFLPSIAKRAARIASNLSDHQLQFYDISSMLQTDPDCPYIPWGDGLIVENKRIYTVLNYFARIGDAEKSRLLMLRMPTFCLNHFLQSSSSAHRLLLDAIYSKNSIVVSEFLDFIRAHNLDIQWDTRVTTLVMAHLGDVFADQLIREFQLPLVSPVESPFLDQRLANIPPPLVYLEQHPEFVRVQDLSQPLITDISNGLTRMTMLG